MFENVSSEMSQSPSALRIGTRASRLALVQAEEVQKRLEKSLPNEEVVLVKIRTTGDRTQTKPLSAIGGEGVFTKEIQRALLDQRIDLAVHSLKDLPTQQPPDLTIAAIPERVMPNDVLITPSGTLLAELPEGSTVATGSLRRKAQLLAHRPDLQVTEIRGNVDTRLRKLKRGGSRRHHPRLGGSSSPGTGGRNHRSPPI
jgi:hydroxymethylbilane synthase